MNPFVYKYQTVESDGRYTWRLKQFKSQAELFAFLVNEKEEILHQRKSIIKRACGGLTGFISTDTIEVTENKSIKPIYENNLDSGILKRTIIANTYWYMDSHSDVHIGREEASKDAIFSESIKERAHKIFPTNEHDNSLDGRIGKTERIYEAPVSWRSLGLGKTGMTEALIADAAILQRKNAARFDDYMNDEIDQHSVAMQYIDQQIAINDEKKYPKEYEVYQKYIPKIGNRQVVEAQGYFFAVPKAKLIEYSCVTAGSNDLTPTVLPSGDTGKSQPSGDAKSLKASELIKFYQPKNHI
jgi:hypothetical protein